MDAIDRRKLAVNMAHSLSCTISGVEQALTGQDEPIGGAGPRGAALLACMELRRAEQEIPEALQAAVAHARDVGWTWEDIASLVGMSPAMLEQRFG